MVAGRAAGGGGEAADEVGAAHPRDGGQVVDRQRFGQMRFDMGQHAGERGSACRTRSQAGEGHLVQGGERGKCGGSGGTGDKGPSSASAAAASRST